MATVKENLIAAKALIDTPEKWHKGMEWQSGAGTCCAVGAVGKVLGKRVCYNLGPEEDALRALIPSEFLTAEEYNDHPNTTHSDIMALYDRAIAAEEAKEAGA